MEAVELTQFKPPFWELVQISVCVKYFPGVGLLIPILHSSFHLQEKMSQLLAFKDIQYQSIQSQRTGFKRNKFWPSLSITWVTSNQGHKKKI